MVEQKGKAWAFDGILESFHPFGLLTSKLLVMGDNSDTTVLVRLAMNAVGYK